MMNDMPDDKEKSRLRDDIDANLKRVYDEALHQDVPDRLRELLDQLQKSGGKTGHKS